MAESSVDYSIDDQDQLVYFNDRWDIFAQENDSAHLIAKNITGQSLFDHISGEELSQLWRFIIDGVRRRQTSVEFDYRCDSPDLKRHMKMRVSYGANRVHFVSTVVRTARADGLKIFATDQKRSKRMILACSWCNRIKAGETIWLEPEIAVDHLQLFSQADIPEISHGICPTCYSVVWDDFEKQLKS